MRRITDAAALGRDAFGREGDRGADSAPQGGELEVPEKETKKDIKKEHGKKEGEK